MLILWIHSTKQKNINPLDIDFLDEALLDEDELDLATTSSFLNLM